MKTPPPTPSFDVAAEADHKYPEHWMRIEINLLPRPNPDDEYVEVLVHSDVPLVNVLRHQVHWLQDNLIDTLEAYLSNDGPREGLPALARDTLQGCLRGGDYLTDMLAIYLEGMATRYQKVLIAHAANVTEHLRMMLDLPSAGLIALKVDGVDMLLQTVTTEQAVENLAVYEDDASSLAMNEALQPPADLGSWSPPPGIKIQ